MLAASVHRGLHALLQCAAQSIPTAPSSASLRLQAQLPQRNGDYVPCPDKVLELMLYMCCLSPCAQPFSPVVMTLVSELEVRGSNLSI